MTDEHVIEAVESLVGIGSGAWDTVNPMDLLDAFRAALSQGKQQAEGLTAWQISERMPNHHRQRTSLENINDVLEVLAALFAENKGDAS